MQAAVVTWQPLRGELPCGKLSEAANWVIQEQHDTWRKSVFSVYDRCPKVYFTYPAYPHIPQGRGGNQAGVMSSTGEFAIVVTDESITEHQANLIMAQYYEEDDERGRPYRLLVEGSVLGSGGDGG